MAFEEDIHALASKIAAEAIAADVALQDRLDSLGKLTVYYALYLKSRGQNDDEPGTFAEVIDRARSVGANKDPVNGGTSAIPIGRRAR